MKMRRATSATIFGDSESAVIPRWVDVYVSVLAALAASLAYLDLANYYYVATDGNLLPKYAYFALAAAIAPLMIVRNEVLWTYLQTPFVFWTGGMITLNFAHWIFLSADGNTDMAGMTLTRIQYLGLAVLIGFLFVQVRPTLLGKLFVALAVVLSALQLFDFFVPGTIVAHGTQGVVAGRASSTLLNANKAAESLVLLAILGMAVLRPHWRLFLLLIVFPGIFLSFSRSGLLVWLLIVAAGFWFNLFPRRTYAAFVLSIPLLAGIATSLLGTALSSVDIAALDDIDNRIMFLSTLDTNDYSSLERLAVAEAAFESFLSQPIFGQGSGYTHFWGASDAPPHNQHLLMLVEYGVVGYLFFLGLTLLLWRGGGYFTNLQSHPMGKVALAAFIAFTPFTHNMFDFLYWLLTFAILAQGANDCQQ